MDTEGIILRIAARQHGVVSREQLVSAGVSADAVDRRLKRGRLGRLHRGVYVVEPLRPPRMREMAAALACGEAAAVSHWSAAVLWDVTRSSRSGLVDVTISHGDRRRMSGIRVHRVRRLSPEELTKLDGIPITTVGRTIIDLAGVADQRALEQALARACRLGLSDVAQIRSLLCDQGTRPGMRKLRAVLDGAEQPAFTRSEAEERFLALLRKTHLPAPGANVNVGGYEVDFLWRAERLVVEIDGLAYHGTSWSFESDRRRDAELTAAGFRVMRVTWRQLVDEPQGLLVRLAQALVRERRSSRTAVSHDC